MSAVKPVNDYGLDAELAAKRNANYDYALQDKAQAWIENITNITFDRDFGPMLQDGVVLCQLVNAIVPGKIKKINLNGNLYQQQENISAFLRACRELGVAESSLFAANTLSQLTDLNQVLICLVAFSTAIQRNPNIKYTGPVLGVNHKRASQRGKSKKWEVKPGGSSGATRLTMGSSSVMEQTKYQDPREMIKQNQLPTKASNDVSMVNKGSAGVMEQTKYTDAREMIKRQQLPTTSSNDVSMLNKGSAGVMEQTKYTDAREMIKRQQLPTTASNDVSMLNKGSAGVMEQTTYTDAREMIKRQQLPSTSSNDVSMLNKGSSGVMEQTTYSDAREMIKRNQIDGKGDGNAVSMLNNGSRGVMEDVTVVDAREMIKREQL